MIKLESNKMAEVQQIIDEIISTKKTKKYYQRLSKNNKSCLCREKKNNKEIQVSRYHNEIFDMVLKRTNYKYFIAGNLNNKYAIYTIIKDKELKISNDHDDIFFDGFLKLKSKYFIAVDNQQYAIYTISNNKEIKLTKDYDFISECGLVKGESNYFLTRDNDYKEAIYKFDKNNKEIQISEKYDEVSLNGLICGTSRYFLVSDENGHAIKEIDGNNKEKLVVNYQKKPLLKKELKRYNVEW